MVNVGLFIVSSIPSPFPKPFDVYRIGSPDEMEETGYEDYFFGKGVCLIEWAGLIEDIIPPGCIRVNISKDSGKGFDYRSIDIDVPGKPKPVDML